MQLLDRLNTTLLGTQGKTPVGYANNPKKVHEFQGPDLAASRLDLNGVSPVSYTPQGPNTLINSLPQSTLDLKKTPVKYQNPETGTTFP